MERKCSECVIAELLVVKNNPKPLLMRYDDLYSLQESVVLAKKRGCGGDCIYKDDLIKAVVGEVGERLFGPVNY